LLGAAKHSFHDQKNKNRNSETTPTSATVQQSPVQLEVEIVCKSIAQKNALGHLDDVRTSVRAAKAIYTEKASLDDFRTGSLFERSEKRRV
jgi:hypothetical protein